MKSMSGLISCLVATAVFLIPSTGTRPCFGADSFAVYQVGAREQRSWSAVRDFLKEKGYEVVFHQAEATLEKHLEKMARINRSQAKFFIALELVQGESTNVLVAMTEQKGQKADGDETVATAERGIPPASHKGNGLTSFAAYTQTHNRFLAADELPVRYVVDSGKLAEGIAGSFKVKVKHLPLFPLFGLDMPGIYLRIECEQDKIAEMLVLLHAGIRNYSRRDVLHEG
jgi:hypothetical protein